ncbi:MAG: ATP synthase F1 subunit epsilon [Actinobacteria bacterium]|nr:ATP synthase F1 subunit epsilon [Actinomycetota bacterium]
MPLHVEIVSPERVLYSGEGDMVVARAESGDIAFLPGHAPYIGSLGVAAVRVLLPQDGEQAAAVHGGFVNVSDDRVIVLSDVAELPEQIDVERARDAATRAEEALRRDEGDAEAKAALARARVRLQVAGATG